MAPISKRLSPHIGRWALSVRHGMLWALLTTSGLASPPTFRADPDYLIDTWETEDGLPENSATAMAQDANGYLWFGTFEGLVRFDGAQFTTIRMPLPRSGVVNMHLDGAGRLWASTYRGIILREGGRWRDVTAADGLTGDLVRTFSERADGALLATTFAGRVFEFAGVRFVELPSPPGARGNAYLGAVDASGKWCVAQHEFIGTWDGARWTPLVPAEDLRGLASDAVGIARSHDGGLWVMLGRELRKFRAGAETARIALPESPGGVWGVFEDSAGHVWISSYHAGLSRVSPDGTMRRWNSANGSHHALRFVFEDRECNIWVGTSGGGLQRFKPRRFRAYGPESGITERNVMSVALAPGGGMFVGTYGGGLFRLENDRATSVPLPGVANVQSVLTDRAGRTWVGAYAQGAWLLENGTARRIPDEQVGGGNVIALFEDSRGRVWISGGQTVAVFDGGAFRTLAAAASDARQIQREDVRKNAPSLFGVTCFAEDTAGTIWLANADNLFRVENDRCVPVLGPPRSGAGSEQRERITGVTCLYTTSASHSAGENERPTQRDLWIYSADQGLLRWRDGRMTAVPFSGAPVLGMVEDGVGYYWMLTGRGIVRSRLSSSGEPCDLTFGLGDGIPSIEGATGRQPVCARDADGRLWFATRKGVASIDPAQLRPNSVAPSVHFETLVYRVLRDGLEVETRMPLDSDPATRSAIVVPAGARQLEFHFSAPSFSAPEKMRFAVQIHESAKPNVDGGPWLDAGPRRVVEFFERPPGNFTLRVRAANDDGVWSSAPAAITFTVEPFYWQRTSFRLAAGLALVAAGGAGVWLLTRARWRRAVERERAAHEIRNLAGRLISAQEAERTRIARELHDDLSQSVALMSVHFDLLAQHPPDTAEFSENMRDLSGQAQRISTEIHRISHELHPAKLEQLGLVPALRGFCRDLGAAHGLAVEFTHDDIPDTLPPDVAICLYRVVQESLHNVIKHAKATRADVRLTAVEKTIRLTVRDDGAGFDSSKPQAKSSLGLVSMKERVRLVDGTLTVESQRGRGTTVALAVAL